MKDSSEMLIESEYKLWKKNIPYLYDLVYTNVLSWPTPSIQWFPDVERVHSTAESVQRLLLTTFTAGAEQENLIIAKIGFPDLVDEDVLNNANITFAQSQSIPVKVEINKARYCPHATNLIACKTEDPSILIYDYTSHESLGSTNSADSVLTGHDDGGFAIEWNPSKFGEILSGGRDKMVNVFDINSGLVRSFANIHSEIVNDVSYNAFNPHVFASVSDDRRLCITDCRSENDFISLQNAHCSTIESVDFSPLKSELIATSSSDCSVKIWDKRCIQKPLLTLRGHGDDVLTVKWSPHYESILASSSKDRRVIMWDLNRSDICCGDESPEILFVHGGHTNNVDDFDWNPAEPMEICSVSSDNVLNVWKVPVEEYI